MERYLVAQRDLAAATKAANEPGKPEISEEAAKSIMQQACNKAGFATVDVCGDTIGYVGLLFSGFNPKTGTFERPADAAQRRIAELNADQRMPAARKAALLAQNRELLEMASLAIPDADLALMNGFRDKILANGR